MPFPVDKFESFKPSVDTHDSHDVHDDHHPRSHPSQKSKIILAEPMDIQNMRLFQHPMPPVATMANPWAHGTSRWMPVFYKSVQLESTTVILGCCFFLESYPRKTILGEAQMTWLL